ncbi:MDR family MFS transporter [Bacillus tuaregi]|uniref:MDR family MFS transporter n=1 Tax=Bacillus tuaregi TaxID=1816695 RepID=UPI0008F84C14|nr:MDR family MFS transporter [Bacillus tuaregi]
MKKVTSEKWVIWALLIATFLTAIEGTIVSTAMPVIVKDLGGSELYTWVISVYLLAMVIGTPVFGKMADLYGRKLMFTLGVIIFLAGSMLSGLAQTMEQLVWFRAIQGIGAGALTTIPFTIIGDVFAFEQRAKIQGMISSVWGISGIIGPLAGGFIVDYISWRWIFFMNLPFGIVSLILLWVSLHEHLEKKKQIIDYPGIFTFAISMTSFLYALTMLKEENGLTGSIMLLLAVAVAGMALFFWIEKNSKEPMLPLSLFKNKLLSVANTAGFLFGFILVTVTFYIPLWVQGVSQLNATLSGISMLPMSITWPVAAMLSGRWLAKTPIGKIAVTGIFFVVAGTFGLTFMKEDTTIAFMMIMTAIMGAGFGLALTAFTVAVQSAVEWRLRGAAMGTFNLLRNLGQAIGIAVSGLWLSEELYGHALAQSLHTVFIILVILAVAALLTGSLLLGKNALSLSTEEN